mmetsp:Transcript_43280/g.90635  ORF Transcript_43280/g.90635 Transcript_43280/m.90635 type:complete len:123 (+) Transcript_43280:275-643(+)
MQTTSHPIDPVDRNHALTNVVEMEAKLHEILNQMSTTDSKKSIVHFSPLAWLIVHGYIPRDSDFTMTNGKPKLTSSLENFIWRQDIGNKPGWEFRHVKHLTGLFHSHLYHFLGQFWLPHKLE